MAEYHLPYGKIAPHIQPARRPECPTAGPARARRARPTRGGGGAGAGSFTAQLPPPLSCAQALRRAAGGGCRPACVVQVAIAINDKTRPVPHKDLLPPLLARLEGLGFAPADITLVIATGTHPPMPPDEFRRSSRRLLGRYPVICHDARMRPTWFTSARRPRDAGVGQPPIRRGRPAHRRRRHRAAPVPGLLRRGQERRHRPGRQGDGQRQPRHDVGAEAQIGVYEDNPCRQESKRSAG